MGKLESKFQSDLIKELKSIFVGCYILKTDPVQMQGVPDLVVLYNDKWATLECKRSSSSSRRPNQERHVNTMNDMSFSRFIFPENKEEVIDELKRWFG